MLILLLFSSHLFAKEFLGESYQVIKHPKINQIIWGFEFINDQEIIFTTKPGGIFYYQLSKKEYKKIFSVKDVYSSGQGGLLDVKKSPQFEQTYELYLTYSKKIDGKGALTLAQVKYDKKNKTITQFKDLKIFKAQTSTSRHFGSRIAFNPITKSLFLSIGDRGVRDNGQETMTHAGSILQLDYHGKPHPSNPYLNDKKFLPEIYSHSHRNPQGLFFDSSKNQLWSTEHGPRGGDELNKIEKGKNYGWAKVSYGKEYWGPFDVGEAKSGVKGMIDPVYQYTPSIAPSSLMIYRKNKFPKWKGLFFISALKHKHINVLTYKKSSSGKLIKLKENKLLADLEQRMRHISSAPNGDVWFSTDSGRLYQITK